LADQDRKARFLYMIALIVAGEAVFVLPFNLARFFRPTVLDVLGFTNTQLGAAQGIYGLVALGAYFVGGPIADRFEARKLLAWSLWSTALGGLYLVTYPGFLGASLLWAFFGLTTILLFWAALIKATREWGGPQQQGLAYGLLDGGRGLLAALLASAGVAALEWSFPDGAAAASFEEKRRTLSLIIYGYTGVTALCGGFVWYALRAPVRPHSGGGRRPSWAGIQETLRVRAVWLQALVVLAAYVGYKGFDNYGLFAVEAYGLDEVEAARVSTIGAWMRPVAALGAGLIADRFRASRVTALAFALLCASDLVFALGEPVPGLEWVLLANTLAACGAIFGLRGLYFALFEEAKVPLAVTGSAVGVVSVIGYTPDIFVAYVAGRFNDAAPGLAGHQHFFMFLAAFAALGLVASIAFERTVTGQGA
jgi:nitrate/nitrite transporter NarK